MSEGSETGAGKPGGRLLIAAGALALLLGGGGFYAVYSGIVALPFLEDGHAAESAGPTGEAGAAARVEFQPGAYVTLDPLVISLGPQSKAAHLRVALVIEAEPGRQAEVEAVRPRVVDVLNVFLRAVDEREFAQPRSMERLRAQMLRRVRLVAPEGAVRDLLVQEFVLN
jgi:flagellar FliL protein